MLEVMATDSRIVITVTRVKTATSKMKKNRINLTLRDMALFTFSSIARYGDPSNPNIYFFKRESQPSPATR
jgi:hypothetical protein